MFYTLDYPKNLSPPVSPFPTSLLDLWDFSCQTSENGSSSVDWWPTSKYLSLRGGTRLRRPLSGLFPPVVWLVDPGHPLELVSNIHHRPTLRSPSMEIPLIYKLFCRLSSVLSFTLRLYFSECPISLFSRLFLDLIPPPLPMPNPPYRCLCGSLLDFSVLNFPLVVLHTFLLPFPLIHSFFCDVPYVVTELRRMVPLPSCES